MVVAVEMFDPNGFGRAWFQPLPDARKKTLTTLMADTGAPDSVTLTDGWDVYKDVATANDTPNSAVHGQQ